MLLFTKEDSVCSCMPGSHWLTYSCSCCCDVMYWLPKPIVFPNLISNTNGTTHTSPLLSLNDYMAPYSFASKAWKCSISLFHIYKITYLLLAKKILKENISAGNPKYVNKIFPEWRQMSHFNLCAHIYVTGSHLIIRKVTHQHLGTGLETVFGD